MNNHNLFYSALLINGRVKMAEYSPSFFFFGVFKDRGEIKVHKSTKKEQG